MANNFGRVNVSIAASTGGLTAGLAQASKQLQSFRSGVTGSVGGLTRTLSSASSSAVGLGSSAAMAAVGVRLLSTAVKTLLLPLLVLEAVTAPFRWLGQAMQAAEELHNLSMETGIATNDLQALQQVASEAGISQQQLTSAVRRSSRMVSELAAGTPAAVKAFQALGLTMEDLAGLSAVEQFELIRQRIAALPPEMQAAASVDIFGRSGQSLLNFIRAGDDAVSEMKRLQEQLGVTLTPAQTAAIEAMGDSLSRLSMPLQGFINQFLAELAPAITTVSNLFLKFFTDNTSGWNMATTLAQGFVAVIRIISGAFNVLYGVFQVFFSALLKFGSLLQTYVSAPLYDFLSKFSGAIADLLDSLSPGAGDMVRGATAMLDELARAARVGGEEMGQAAAESWTAGVENITNPFAAFDAEMAAVQAQSAEAGKPATPIESVAAAIAASTKELKAIVVGSAEGEAFRNALARGADPRTDIKQDAARTADATERTADGVEDLADAVAQSGVAVAAIMV